MKNLQKNFVSIVVTIGIVALVLGAGILLYYQPGQNDVLKIENDSQSQNTREPAPIQLVPMENISNWKTYHNKSKKFGFKYPAELNNNGVADGGGIVFSSKQVNEYVLIVSPIRAGQYFAETAPAPSTIAEHAKINGYDVIFVSSDLQNTVGANYEISASVLQTGNTITFDLYIKDKQNKDKYLSLLKTILSTFNFDPLDQNLIDGKLNGYFTRIVEYNEKVVTGECQGFVVINGDQEIKEFFSNLISRGDTLNSKNAKGQLVINIEYAFDDLPFADADKIRTSTANKPVIISSHIRDRNQEPVPQNHPVCLSSMIQVLKVE